WHTEHLPCHGFRGARCSTASTRAASATAVGLTMKLVGKPDAGNRHVRFDERGQETECCHMAQATAPVLDSTNERSLRSHVEDQRRAARERAGGGRLPLWLRLPDGRASDRVAVRRALCDGIDAYVARGAGPILHHEWLAERVLQPLSQN